MPNRISKLFIALFLSLSLGLAGGAAPGAARAQSGAEEPAVAAEGEDEQTGPAYDEAPKTPQDFEKAVEDYYSAYDLALKTGGEELAQKVEKPHWENEISEEIVPDGYEVEKVLGDSEFGDEYYTFFPKYAEESAPAPAADEADGPSITVNSYSELKAVLEANNGYTHIYLGSDISQGSYAGIAVHASKTAVVIDGRPEGSSENAAFAQKASTAITDIIYVPLLNTGTKSITLRNINVSGANLFGFVSAELGVQGLDIRFENVNYTGPALSYNRNGSVLVNGGVFNMVAVTGGGLAAELAEAAQVQLAGTISVTAENSPHAIIWLTGNSTQLRLLSGANVRVKTNHYFIYADGSFPTMVLEEGARLDYTGGYYGLVFADQMLESLTLEENASLAITQTTTLYANGAIRLYSALLMQEGSSLYINRSTGGAAIQLLAPGASVIMNKPERVMLYAPSGRLVGFVVSGTIQINTDSINIWKTADSFVADSIDSNPSYAWNKAANQLLTVNSSFVGTTQTVSSNLDENDPTSGLTASAFALRASQMLVLGRFSLSIDPVYENANAVSGSTERGASLRVSAGGQPAGSGVAGSAFYTVPLLVPPQGGSLLVVLAHHNYLQKQEHTAVIPGENGVLRFTHVPATLNFGEVEIPEETGIIQRPEGEFYVAVEDTRPGDSSWSLLLSIERPLTAHKGGKEYVLENGLAFVDSAGSISFLQPGSPVPVATGNTSQVISFAPDQGLVLYINPSAVMGGISYSTTVHWALQDAP